MRSLPWLALLAATGAGAQTTLTLTVNDGTSVLLAKNDCARTLAVNWTFAAGGAGPCTDHQDLVIWATKNTTCGNDPATGDFQVGTVPQSTWATTGSGSFTLRVVDLPVFAGATCPVNNTEVPMKLCAYVKYLPLGAVTCLEGKPATAPTITYDSAPPAAPTLDSLVPLDGALQVNFTAGNDASSMMVAYQSTIGPYTTKSAGPASAGSFKLDGLTNGVTYAVLVYALDEAGNQSDDSNIINGTPVPSFGFFSNYQKSGGDTQGCAAAPAGALPLLGLGWLSRRRRRSPGGRRS
ncbi:MAG TPA: MXAN_2561 family MXYO-CTERM-anchored protein [Myxococcaceae bacterium]|nr:MXAN_2561 family MXYO-CTERM-anchored protein [Myxococcaceae bacterium]